jgi:hypothetical protein
VCRFRVDKRWVGNRLAKGTRGGAARRTCDVGTDWQLLGLIKVGTGGNGNGNARTLHGRGKASPSHTAPSNPGASGRQPSARCALRAGPVGGHEVCVRWWRGWGLESWTVGKLGYCNSDALVCAVQLQCARRVKSQECCPSLPRRPSRRCSTLARGVTDSEGCGSESLVGRQRLRRLAQSRPSNFTPLQDGGREGSLSTTTKRASTLIFTAVLPHRCVRFW